MGQYLVSTMYYCGETAAMFATHIHIIFVVAGRLLEFAVRKIAISFSPNTTIRKLGVKLIQRVGLVYLKARVASWR